MLQYSKLNQLAGAIFTLFFGFFVLWFLHGDVLFSDLNNLNLGDNFDGIKNYFTPYYHVKWDSAYSWFTGMNYPFGDHTMFVDNQPVIFNTLKWLSNYFPFIKDNVIAITNGIALFSIPLSGVAFYLLFTAFGLPTWYSCIIAVPIAMGSPQLLRVFGHFGLSYSFCFPFIWWLCKRYFHSNGTWYQFGIIGIFVTIFAGFHFYHFALISSFILSYLLIDVVLLKELDWKKRLLIVALTIVLPFAIYQGWLIATDPVTDRPSNPYGFFAYRALFHGYVIPYGFSFGEWLKQLFPLPHTKWGSQLYLGINAIIVAVILIIGGIKKLISKTSFSPNKWLLASGIVFLFSLGIPFIFGMHDLLNYLGPIKQFRAIGRFGWVIYVVVNVVAFVFIYTKTKTFKPITRNVILVLSIGLLYLEVADYQVNKLAIANHKKPNLIQPLSKELEWLDKIDPTTYQAIIPLPYFFVGADGLNKVPSGNISPLIFKAVQYSGIPTTGSLMGRTSDSQTFEQFRLMLEELEAPKWLDTLSNDKPFLILEDKSVKTNSFLIQKAIPIYSGDKINLYSIAFDSLKATGKGLAKKLIQETDSLSLERGVLFATNNEGLLFTEGFEAPISISNPRESTTVLKIEQSTKDTLIVSFWVDFEPDLENIPKISAVITTKGLKKRFMFRDNIKMLNNYQGLIEIEFSPLNNEAALNIAATSTTNTPFSISNVMVRSKGTDVYLKSKESIMKNNRWYSVN